MAVKKTHQRRTLTEKSVDLRYKTAVLSAALRSNAIAHYSCTAGLAAIKNVFDYQEPQDNNEALANPDPDNWVDAMT